MTVDDAWLAASITPLNRDAFGTRIADFTPGPPLPSRSARPGPLVPLARVATLSDALLRQRRSVRTFADHGLTDDDLAAVLGALAEVDGRRSYPAAGGIYTLTLVAWLFDCAAPLEGRTVQYDATAHALADLGPVPNWQDEDVAFTALAGTQRPPVLLGLFTDLAVLRAKYGDRADRFALLEAGAALEAVSLAVTARGLAGYAVGGGTDDRMLALAGLSGVGLRFVVGYALGRPLSRAATPGAPGPPPARNRGW